jgi:putative transposase
MRFVDSQRHHRRSIRLKGYDYTRAGAYFITIVAQHRRCLFGEIVDGTMRRNDAGDMVQRVWDAIPEHYPGTDIDTFALMPNHFHAIIVLVGAAPRGRPHDDDQTMAGQARGPAPTDTVVATGGALSLGDVVHRFKSMTTQRYADGVRQSGWPPFPVHLWQRNYFEHIIRDEASLHRIREYIAMNPLRWAEDPENPERPGAPA